MRKLEIVVPNDYTPSAGEVNNIVYLTCKHTCGWPMRMADLAVCTMMAGEMKGQEGLQKLFEVTIEYVWDHICGEPEETTTDDFAKHLGPILEEWFQKTTPEDRAKID
jgi:hypothetical protein